MTEACPATADLIESAATRGSAASPVGHINARRVSAVHGYNAWAATYDCDPNPLLALEGRLLLARLCLCKGKAALDLACGTGRWLAKLVSLGARSATGIDLSSSMLRIAASKPSLSGRLVMADCQLLPLRSNVADFIICSFALSHIADDIAFAKELARVARPGASIFLTDLHPEAYARGWRTSFRAANSTIEIASVPRPFGRWREVFEAQGLNLLDFEEPKLGIEERPIFEASGRAGRFDEAAALRALLLCHFSRAAF